MLDAKTRERLRELIAAEYKEKPRCVLCGEEITDRDANEADYSKTRRNMESWWHTRCLKRYGYGGKDK